MGLSLGTCAGLAGGSSEDINTVRRIVVLQWPMLTGGKYPGAKWCGECVLSRANFSAAVHISH